MKRIQTACLNQTIHFKLKDDIDHSQAISQVHQEYTNYKRHLDSTHTKYKLVSEETQKDGSIIIKIKKQFNDYAIGTYLE